MPVAARLLCVGMGLLMLCGAGIVVIGAFQIHSADRDDHADVVRDECLVMGYEAASCSFPCNCRSEGGHQVCDTCFGTEYHYDVNTGMCGGLYDVGHLACGNEGPEFQVGENHSCFIRDNCTEVEFAPPDGDRSKGITLVVLGGVLALPCLCCLVGCICYAGLVCAMAAPRYSFDPLRCCRGGGSSDSLGESRSSRSRSSPRVSPDAPSLKQSPDLPPRMPSYGTSGDVFPHKPSPQHAYVTISAS